MRGLKFSPLEYSLKPGAGTHTYKQENRVSTWRPPSNDESKKQTVKSREGAFGNDWPNQTSGEEGPEALRLQN